LELTEDWIHRSAARGVLPQPLGATVYELSASWRELEMVLHSLARWGSRALPAQER
jgi:DNA-binding HxlR family transcriptional regulator